MKNRVRSVVAAALLVTILAWVGSGEAQEPAGAVAALEGQAEVLRQGAGGWTAVVAGDPVFLGDEVRTLEDSKLKLLFGDDSVLTLAENSRLAVNERLVQAEAPVSRFSLLLGTVRAVVTELYANPGARFELETPTAIAGVRGTGFIASYDETPDETVVVGLVDKTLVRSRIDPEGKREVALGPGEMTTVLRGSLPIEPRMMPEDVLQSLGAATAAAGNALPQRGAQRSARQEKAAGGDPRVAGPVKHRGQSAEAEIVDQPTARAGGIGRPAPPPPPVP